MVLSSIPFVTSVDCISDDQGDCLPGGTDGCDILRSLSFRNDRSSDPFGSHLIVRLDALYTAGAGYSSSVETPLCRTPIQKQSRSPSRKTKVHLKLQFLLRAHHGDRIEVFEAGSHELDLT